MRIPPSTAALTPRPAADPQQRTTVAPREVARNAVVRFDQSVFEAAPARPVTPAVAVNTDGLLTWPELSPAQQHLFGPSGAQTYAKLSTDDRAVFLLLTRRMDRNGVDYGGLTLKDPLETIRRNRLLFNHDAEGIARFKASLEQGLESGAMFEDKPFEPFHQGMGDWGVREDRRKWTTQYGIGDGGAFVDVDRYNYKADWKAWLGHTAEILDPRRPSPLDIAEELGEDLRSKGTRDAA